MAGIVVRVRATGAAGGQVSPAAWATFLFLFFALWPEIVSALSGRASGVAGVGD
jgi:nitrate reductase NapE component